MPKIYDLLVFGAFILIIYIILYRMGSRPRKRKAVNNPGTQSNGNDAASQDMVEKCLAASKPLGKLSRQLPSTPQPQSSQDNPEFNPSTLLVRPLTQVILPHPNNMNLVARPVGLGVDPKIKAKCFAYKFVKVATLLPKSPFVADEKFK